jgi:hypothetical protein
MHVLLNFALIVALPALALFIGSFLSIVLWLIVTESFVAMFRAIFKPAGEQTRLW